MRLLVGLGNPGKEYDGTRHNLGFDCVDAVAKHLGASNWKAFKGGMLAESVINKEKALIFKPQEFMNRSGLPIRQIVDYYGIAPHDVCIVADDVYVAPGSVRIRKSGGDGGHNGWKSVIEHLDPDSFWRVKIGAGVYEQHPDKRAHQPALEEYVLKPMPKHEQKAVADLIDRVVPDLVQWLEHGTLETETVHL
jgi:PTH1 family peptidyl-tRNA hydrolase